MAIVTFKSDTSATLTLTRSSKIFTYYLRIGYEVVNLQYEQTNHTLSTISGKIVEMSQADGTITINNSTIPSASVIRLDNMADLIAGIDISDLDIDTNGKPVDANGTRSEFGNPQTTIIIGADGVIDGSGNTPDPVIDANDYVPLTFGNPDEPIHDLIYDQYIQKTSYIQANMAAVFREWFVSFFPPTHFRHVRMKNESSYTAFKSFMKDIYKKEAPLLVIDPNTIEHVDDFLFGTNVVNRYNLVDPSSDNTGAKILYSLAMLESDKIRLHYRRNRFRFRFDTLIMERSLDRAIDIHNFMIMNMRHQSKFMLFRKVLNLVPAHMIRSIAKINGFNVPDDKFLDWLNAHALSCTFVKRVLPNGQLLFFAEQDCHIQVETPDMPTHDSPEMSDAIEMGARVTDSFIFTVDLPTEFFCTMDHVVAKQYDRYKEGDDPEIHYITKSDDYKWEYGMLKEIGEYTLFNRTDAMIQSADDNVLHMVDVIRDVDQQLGHTIDLLLSDSDVNLPSPLFMVKVIEQTQEFTNFVLNDKGVLTINNPDYTKIYHIYTYVNQKYINMYAAALNSEYIGTVEKTPY